MKKKIISLTAAAIMCVTSLAGCGDKDKSGKSGSKASVSGTYYRIAFDGKRTKFVDDLDKGLKEDIAREYFAGADITLSDGKFKTGKAYNSSDNQQWYEGSYSIGNDNTIILEYERANLRDSSVSLEKGDTIDKLKENPPDTSKLKEAGTSDEEYRKAIEELGAYQNKLDMLEFNKNGTYHTTVGPAISYSDRLVSYSTVPLFIMNIAGTQKGENQAVMLKQKGDFLCVDTYGFELDGKYKSGKDFTINYNPMDTMKADKFSRLNRQDDPDWGKYEEILNFQLKCSGDFNTTIDFSGGEWKWYNCDNELINNGEYQESKEYPGLISMYVTEDSSDGASEIFMSAMPVFFYISDGKIYYPGFIKTD